MTRPMAAGADAWWRAEEEPRAGRRFDALVYRADPRRSLDRFSLASTRPIAYAGCNPE